MYYSCHPKRFEYSGKGKKKLFLHDGIFYCLNHTIIVLRLTTIVLSSRHYTFKFSEFLIWWFNPSNIKRGKLLQHTCMPHGRLQSKSLEKLCSNFGWAVLVPYVAFHLCPLLWCALAVLQGEAPLEYGDIF